MKHTEHYQLSQFESDDRIQMEDFNADNAKIDAAIAAAADGGLKVTHGTWTGNGTVPRTIRLPVTPHLLLLFGENNTSAIVGFCTQQKGRYISSGVYDAASTFQLSGNQLTLKAAVNFNKSGDTVYYFAIY